MQVVVGGDFDIQPDGRVKRRAAPLLKLGGNGVKIALQHRQRLGDRYFQRLDGVKFSLGEAHQMDGLGFARFVKAERKRRAAVADVLAAADDLRPVYVPERNVVGWREVLRRKGIQRADIDVAYGVTFTGPDGGEMPGRNHRNRLVAAQGAGIGVLLVIIIGDGLQEMLLFFHARQPRLALHDVARP